MKGRQRKPGMSEGGRGHELYEVFRTTSDLVEKAKIGAEGRACYDSIRGAAGG